MHNQPQPGPSLDWMPASDSFQWLEAGRKPEPIGSAPITPWYLPSGTPIRVEKPGYIRKAVDGNGLVGIEQATDAPFQRKDEAHMGKTVPTLEGAKPRILWHSRRFDANGIG